MKKILSILSTTSLVISSSSLVIACNENIKEFKTIDFEKPPETIKEFESIKLKIKNRSKINALKIESSSNLNVELVGEMNDEIIIKAGSINKTDENHKKEWIKLTAKNAYTELIEFEIVKNPEGYKNIKVEGLNEDNSLDLKAGSKSTIVILNYEELINFKIDSSSTESINYIQNGDNIIVNAKENAEIGFNLKLFLSADNVEKDFEANIKII